MHRHLNRLGLSLLLTFGVVVWNQQQMHSFSQSPSQPAPLFFSVAQALSDSEANLEAEQLLEAVKAGDVAAVRAALDSGINPDVGDIYSGFALSYAAGAGNLEIMRLLLDRGATVNITTDEGYTPLMEATVNQQTVAVQLLLEARAEPNIVAAGQTPLAVAVMLNNLELAQLLLAGGADVHLSSQGQSVLQIAETEGNSAMMNLLQQAEAVQK
jgi:ankyrin repeat protein